MLLLRFDRRPGRRDTAPGVSHDQEEATSLTLGFKAGAVRLCRVSDRSIPKVPKDLGLVETSLRDWVQRADVNVGKDPPQALTSGEREERAFANRSSACGWTARP